LLVDEVCHVGSQLAVTAWLDDNAEPWSDTQVHFAQGYSACARFKNRAARTVVLRDLHVRYATNSGRLPYPDAPYECDLVLSAAQETGPSLYLKDVLFKSSLKRLQGLRSFGLLPEFACNLLGLPKQVAIPMVECGTRKYRPFPLDDFREVQRFSSSDGFDEGREFVLTDGSLA